MFIGQGRCDAHALAGWGAGPGEGKSARGHDGGQGYRIVQFFNFMLDASGKMNDLGSAASGNPACDPI